ncbi:ABC transporter permease [Anaeromyxobacter terrae]|uniref:ABC transporter permease n=1 Tax=Anaeromyxobacter terrae TaxID=2925406 RepID=UPI001F5970C7|nr:FtsX-like permease family protein [Anaeromyxobacter sp. SG22]
MWMLFIFIGDLRRRWAEYALGAAAVALVVAALVTHRAVTASAEESVHELAHRLGRNMLVVPAATDLSAFHARRFGSEALPDTYPDTIRSSRVAEHVRSIEARLYGNVRAGTGEVVVVGQDLDWPSLGDAEPAILGAEAARALGVAAGGTFSLGGRAFLALRIADPPPDGLDGAVFMPLAAAQRVLGRPGELSALRLGGCWCRIDVATLAGEVEKLVPGARAVTVAGMVKAQKGSVETMQRYSTVLHLTGFAVVALVIGSLAASQARRRARELGLLVAVGASPRALAGMFALQAAIAGAVGGVVGWALAAPLTRQLGASLLASPLAPPAGLLLPAAGLAALVSAGAALVPAARAASLDPTVVLRES